MMVIDDDDVMAAERSNHVNPNSDICSEDELVLLTRRAVSRWRGRRRR
jgi:hypothetical protein